MENPKIEELLTIDLLLSILKNNGISTFDELIDLVADRVAKKLNETPKQESEFYTSKEICKIYRISSTTLERMIRSGLKFESKGAKTKRLFTKKDFENFKNKKR